MITKKKHGKHISKYFICRQKRFLTLFLKTLFGTTPLFPLSCHSVTYSRAKHISLRKHSTRGDNKGWRIYKVSGCRSTCKVWKILGLLNENEI